MREHVGGMHATTVGDGADPSPRDAPR
jgi:hypothetical protein